jgi:DNA topoisomerase-1
LEAYCVKCKTKREMKDPQAVFTANGVPGTRGECPACGTKMFRMGRTPAHEGMTPPKVKCKAKKRARKGKLVIVESPAKARTVGRYLGKGYKVKASVGHVRDLLRSQLSVDVDNGFQPKYRVPNEKRQVVKEIKELAKSAEEIYLATDPDREGEAIAWHVREAAGMSPERTHRVVFHEITRPAIETAFAHPREINMDLVNAQQARRVLDRLVGYKLSPLLWRKIRGRLSAGRVQSVALRLVVEREQEINDFVPQEYWTIEAEFLPEGGESSYIANLAKIDGQKLELSSEEQVQPILQDMQGAAYQITKLKRGERRRKPAAPFITSSMQQEAFRRLGFTARKTMSIAQQLYEGIDIGNGGNTGLITYMRTDSTNVSKLAQDEAREYIRQVYGEKFVPEKPHAFRTRARRAQEAHEAIRPTSVRRVPEQLKSRLSRDQFRLYQLIWKRFVASQMAIAVFDTISVEITGRASMHEYLLRASGSKVKSPGFLVLYEEAKDENNARGEVTSQIPAGISVGQPQKLLHLIPEQHFTQPPPRYTDATLIRTLEENGVGRPSTYAPILSTLQQRGYVVRDGRKLIPTETGILVNGLLTEHFPNIIDVDFTAQMEKDLDKVASGDRPWVDVIQEFYHPFEEQVARADAVIPKIELEDEKVGRNCPKCAHELIVRWGRYGKFISCSNFPDCRYTEPWLKRLGVACPQDGGELVERRTRRGRTFYGCANYPKCDFASWKRPLPTPCPQCKGLLVVDNKTTARCTQCETRFRLEEVSSSEGETA